MLYLLVLSFGDLISMLGSSLTSFAFGIWLFQRENSAVSFSIGLFLFHLPKLFFIPIFGSLIDNMNRKQFMLAINTLAILLCIYLVVEYRLDGLTASLIYFSQASFGIISVAMELSFSALIPTLVQQQHLIRANGIVSFVDSAVVALAPIVSGFLYKRVSLDWMIIIDSFSFLIAIISFVWVPLQSPDHVLPWNFSGSVQRLISDIKIGFKFILGDSKLLFLQSIFAASNLIIGITMTATTSLVLLKTNNDSLVLGAVRTAGGVGGIVGGLLLMVIPKKENLIKYILLGMACMVTGGWLVIALGNNPIFWYVGSFLGMCFLVTVNAFNQTIWQSVVKSEHRGKVLGARAWIAQSLYPLGFMISGLLVDRVFESQTISQYAHWLPFPSTFSIGPGSGSAVLLILTSLIMYAVLCIGWILTQTTTGKFD